MPRALRDATARTAPTREAATTADAADSQKVTPPRVLKRALVYAPMAKSPACPRDTRPVKPTRIFIPPARPGCSRPVVRGIFLLRVRHDYSLRFRAFGAAASTRR